MESPIEVAEREIRRDREDLARLKSRYPGCDFVSVAGNTGPPSASLPLTIPPAGSRPVRLPPRSAFLSEIEQAVADAVDSAPNQDWTSRTVVTTIRDRRSYLLSDHDTVAMNGVQLALTSLVQKQRIARVHEGRGRDPHRYRSILNGEKEAFPEEETS